VHPHLVHPHQQERRRYFEASPFSRAAVESALLTPQSLPGVSLITQAFYLLVFLSRYLPFPLWQSYDPKAFHRAWNVVLKPFYIMTSAYIIFLMMRVYARTREREKAWKIGGWSLGGSLLAAPFVMMIFRSRYVWSFSEVCIHVLP